MSTNLDPLWKIVKELVVSQPSNLNRIISENWALDGRSLSNQDCLVNERLLERGWNYKKNCSSGSKLYTYLSPPYH